MSLSAVPYNAVQIEVPDGTVPTNTADQGLDTGDVAWGDFDNDGDLDVLTHGIDDAGANQVRIYRKNAGATYTVLDIETTAAQRLANGGVAWGDFDNDGDLDALVSGLDGGGNRELRVYRNNAGAFDPVQVNVESGANLGLSNGGVAWGDSDNDGDMDVLACGSASGGGTPPQLRVYRNNGNGAFDPVQIEVGGAANSGLENGDCAFGDYNADGLLDVAALGLDNVAGGTRRLRVYRNNGNNTFTQIPDGGSGLVGLQQGGLAWGDCDADGDIDLLASGNTAAGTRWIRAYRKNNGLDSFTAVDVEATAGERMDMGKVAWGDSDNDGDLDVLVSGQDGAGAPELRVYRNNAACTNFEAVAQTEVDGANGGLTLGGVAWGDSDGDGRIDVLANGNDGSGAPNSQVRVYLNTTATANTAPNAPAGLAASFAYAASPAVSTASFQWDPSTDAGAGATPAALLTYDIQISTTAGFTGGFVFSGQLGASPRRGAFHRPPLVGGKHTVILRSTSPLDADLAPVGLQANTTYYFRVRTVDAGLMESGWTAGPSLYMGVPPSAVTTLAVAAATSDGQIVLNWTAPAGGAGGTYDVRWALSAIASDALFNAATPLTGEPAPAAAGTPETMFVRGVPPEQTVFFALKTMNTGGTSALSNSPSGTPLAFDRTPLEVAGAAGLGLDRGDVTWGDVDGDGLWDIVAAGIDAGGTRRLRIYRNTGGAFAAPLELPGLANGNVALGDFNGDGRPDVLASGNDGTAAPNRQLRVHVNASTPGVLSFPSTVNVPGAADQGFDSVGTNNGGGCGLEWADINSDGDLDVVVCGDDPGGTARLYVYFNNGGSTFNTTPLAVSANFYRWGDLAVADLNNDGRPDVAAVGYNTGNAAAQLAVYRNVNGASFVESVLPGPLSSSALDAGDLDNDGYADLLVQGFSGNRQLRVTRNTTASPGAAPTFAAAVDVPGAANQGLNRGEVGWGDYNNDGFLDVLAQGSDAGAVGDGGELRLYAGDGTATGWGAVVNVAQPDTALVNEGALAWGDFDQDGDPDVLAGGSDQIGGGGTPQLRVYVNYWGSTPGAANNPPSAPAVLATDFAFSATASSTATFKWDPAADDITPPAGLKYQVQAATTAPAYSAPLAINTPSPQYFPQIYDGNTRHGTVLVSTNPWDPQSGTLTGLVTDTTYYFHVKTIDGGSLESGWSADGSLWTGVAPSTSTIAAASGAPGEATVSWLSAGDDANQGLLTGDHRIQYSTEPSTPWSAASTPAGAFTATVSTTAQAPGSAQSHTAMGLTEGTSYYFVLWTRDDVGLWSALSNQTTAFIQASVRDLTIDVVDYDFGTVGLGVSTQTLAPITVAYTGTTNSTFRLSASTVTPGGSPWAPDAAPAADRFRVYAAFDASQPAPAAFGPEDVVLGAPQPCTATAFALGQGCLNLPTGTARILWLRLDMPTSSSEPTAMEQRVQITVEAGPP